jgi:hypothetical protein
MLALHAQKTRVHGAISAKVGNAFHDVRLRGDRVRGDNLDPGQPYRFGNRMAPFEDLPHKLLPPLKRDYKTRGRGDKTLTPFTT